MFARTSLLLMLAVAGATPLVSQTEDRPNRGKIDGVEREKDKSGSTGDDGCDCGWLGWLDFSGIDHLLNPRGIGRGYAPYPYAGGDTAAPFAVSRAEHGRRYGTVSLSYFDDAAATLAGGRFAFEAAASLAYVSFEASVYREPLATETDWLYGWRLAGGLLPRLGPRTMLRIGIGGRGFTLDDGSVAGGPELELGAQFLPRRPFGASVTGRVAAMQWEGGAMFPYRELNTTGSLFLGRVELQLGWHWAKIGSAPAFGGPTIGSRLWF